MTHPKKHQAHFVLVCVSSRAHHPSSPGRISPSHQGLISSSTTAPGYMAGMGVSQMKLRLEKCFTRGLDQQPPVLQLGFRSQFLCLLLCQRALCTKGARLAQPHMAAHFLGGTVLTQPEPGLEGRAPAQPSWRSSPAIPLPAKRLGLLRKEHHCQLP